MAPPASGTGVHDLVSQMAPLLLLPAQESPHVRLSCCVSKQTAVEREQNYMYC